MKRNRRSYSSGPKQSAPNSTKSSSSASTTSSLSSSTTESSRIPVNISTPVTLTETHENSKVSSVSPCDSNPNLLELTATPSTIPTNTTTTSSTSTSCTADVPDADPVSCSMAKELIALFCAKAKQKAHSVESLPVFLYPKLLESRLSFLSHFKSLLRLELVFCRISDLELAPLSSIYSDASHPHPLQVLNLSHNLLCELAPIRNLVNLRELHIGQNQVASLDVVRHLCALTVLDFHDNLVEDLAPIVHCAQLRIVRGGKNRIHSISKLNLERLRRLELLNLSANHLLYYDEIDVLAEMPSLRQLELNDPHFGANPICALSNYHIYSLFKLRQIESLDGIQIDAHSKQKAQISMYKKTMFYQILYDARRSVLLSVLHSVLLSVFQFCTFSSFNLHFG